MILGKDQTVKDVIAFGVPVHVAGTVTDAVVVIGGAVTLAETARVRGDVYVLGAALEQIPGARVDGSITIVSRSVTAAIAGARQLATAVVIVLLLVRLAIVLAVMATAWQLAGTEFAVRQTQRVAGHPVRVIGLGLLWATLLGTAALVASLTVVGLPLGGLLLLLSSEGTLGLALAMAWVRQPARFTMGGRRLLIGCAVLLGALPLVGDAFLYAAAALGLGITVSALAEARGARRAALEPAR